MQMKEYEAGVQRVALRQAIEAREIWVQVRGKYGETGWIVFDKATGQIKSTINYA